MCKKFSRGERKREEILDAAIDAFCENGFVGSSMDDISARANASKRTVYNHFSGKEALFEAIIDHLGDEIDQTLVYEYRDGEPIERQLRELGMVEGRLLMSPRFIDSMRMLLTETLRCPEMMEKKSRRFDKTRVIIEFFERAAAAGALRIDDPETAAGEFLALIKARAFWPVIHSRVLVDDETMKEVIDRAVQMIMARYRPKETGAE